MRFKGKWGFIGRLACSILATMMIGSLLLAAGCGVKADRGFGSTVNTSPSSSGTVPAGEDGAGSKSDTGSKTDDGHLGESGSGSSGTSGAAEGGDAGEARTGGGSAGSKTGPNSAAGTAGSKADAAGAANGESDADANGASGGAGQTPGGGQTSAAGATKSGAASGSPAQGSSSAGTDTNPAGQQNAGGKGSTAAGQTPSSTGKPSQQPTDKSADNAAAKKPDTTTDKPAQSKPASSSASSAKPGSSSSTTSKPDAAASTPSKPNTPPAQTKPAAPPVKLDKPTEPAMPYQGKSGAKLVALTFDDGPDNRYTPEILDILKAQHLHATFFTVGIQVKRYGPVVQRIVKEGHEIGNHTYSHSNLSKLDSTAILNQIKWTDTLIQRQVGFVPKLVRAPFGASSPLLKQIVADNGRSLVFWTVDTRDWEGSTVSAMRANVNKNTHPGGIILMHSFGSKHIGNTVKVLPLVIKDLQAKGYTFVTVSELLDAKARNKQAAAKKK
ncbi:polysaccharide deacetylase family protein [Paenibacillus rhizovicinus]|uniref:Polysaccharide deacetylase family protein n=1 Tax=Paenibacillus rhizovicinus TaxID=2704463 RepID=A0A6C0NZ01_9BACL|nr:polysaccharide deacetylase family protein [Paenibacillus rhizovicinus]QHW31480.1 polysaccharide deacetylase family protein [Paenibacillus rhizovicinus]